MVADLPDRGPVGCEPVALVRGSSHSDDAGGRPAIDLPASIAGAIAALVTAALLCLGP
jgi:hypothetical protein